MQSSVVAHDQSTPWYNFGSMQTSILQTSSQVQFKSETAPGKTAKRPFLFSLSVLDVNSITHAFEVFLLAWLEVLETSVAFLSRCNYIASVSFCTAQSLKVNGGLTKDSKGSTVRTKETDFQRKSIW